MDPPLSIEPLERYHEVAGFDCGVGVLNAYLIERAQVDQRVGQAHVFVALRGDYVVAYASLMAASVRRQQTRAEALRGEQLEVVTAILLSRLAVDLDEQGHRLGEWMLLEALARAGQAAAAIGARAVLVHAKSEGARSFYERYGLQRSPIGPLHLMLPIKDIRRTLPG